MMEQTQARVNIYALLSRILLQELDVETLKIIKNDPMIMDFLPQFQTWKPLEQESEKNFWRSISTPIS